MSAYYPEFDENTLLGEWLSYWLETYVKPTAKPSSYEHYRDNCEKHIIPSLGEIPIGEISAKMLQRFFNEQARTGNLRDTARSPPRACAICVSCWMSLSSRL